MNATTKIVVFSVLGLALATGAFLLYPKVTELFAASRKDNADDDEKNGLPVVYRKELGAGETPLPDDKGDPGLRIKEETRKGLTLEVKEAVLAVAKRALPPQVGTINYDNETMLQITPRFPGELSEMSQMAEFKEEVSSDSSARYVIKERLLKIGEKIKKEPGLREPRPIKFGDKVKQGDVLVEFWSQTLGVQKAAFVDAISAVNLSQKAYERQLDLFKEGAISLAALKAAERQLQGDNNNLLTAERTLRMWKLTDEEITGLRKEAKDIIDALLLDPTKKRNVLDEVEKWAKVQVKVPVFDKSEEGKKRELTILEKNINIGSQIDNTNFGTTLFRLADMSRLQIWVYPPEEYLEAIRKNKEKAGNGKPKWEIRLQADPTHPLELDIEQVSRAFEPTQHNPMVIGYIDNKDYRYFVGQALTATIYVDPLPNTVEIPTDALNEIKGQSFVFVRDEKNDDKKKGEYAYSCRRVSVVQRFKEFSIVRSELTDKDKTFSKREVQEGRWPLRPLWPNELVVTRGVVEMTTALENLLIRERAKELAQQNQ